MALKSSRFPDHVWQSPHWSDPLPDPHGLQAVYGLEADELTIRFPDTPDRDIVVLFIATPDVEYAALMVHESTGEVVGVQVDYLKDYAQRHHPAWRAATALHPSSSVAARIVRDIKDLFNRYGIDPDTAD